MLTRIMRFMRQGDRCLNERTLQQASPPVPPLASGHRCRSSASKPAAASVHRERIGVSGTLASTSAEPPAADGSVPRPPGIAAAAPTAPPATAQQLQQLVDLIHSHRRVVALTGAGVSTESNVPDYRGPNGAYTTGFSPMTHQQFMAKAENRARYWARSFVGWHEFAHVQPNAAHHSLARLQTNGWVGTLITQNVDRLHHKGGSPAAGVLELHGTTHRVVCTACGAETCRHEMQRRLAALNPETAALAQRIAHARDVRGAWRRALAAGTAADARKTTNAVHAEQVPVRRPDGDVELADAGLHFAVPACSACDGILKPSVTFFGDSVPKERAHSALRLAEEADLLLVVGSSLMVWSAFRLAKATKAAGGKLAVVNVGETRADSLADYKVGALAGEVLARLAAHPTLLLPCVAR